MYSFYSFLSRTVIPWRTWNYYWAVFSYNIISDLGDAFFLFAYDASGKVSANEVGACIRWFFLIFGGHKSFLWGHSYSSFGLLVTSPLGFKVRVGSLICAEKTLENICKCFHTISYSKTRNLIMKLFCRSVGLNPDEKQLNRIKDQINKQCK